MRTGSHNPKRYGNDEEASQVEDQNNTLNKWQPRGQYRVEKNRKTNDGNSQERAMVVLPHVVGVIQRYQTLDDKGHDEANTCEVDLPSNSTKPA